MPENLKTHSEPASNQETSSNPELFSTLESNAVAERQLGAATLAAANFDSRHKEIVDSSFNKARENGEKLPGKNNERRNYAYLSRLEKLIDKYGNEAEKKLWQASIKDDLLIDYDNIPESYWQAKRQELRDNGYGDIELTEDYKRELFNKERELQEESLEKWVNYLGDEHSPYPLWFKIYAWDGMTKMGKYDKSKGKYATRNETTVAPYPNPDAEVLGGVFEVVNRYYGNNEREFYTEEGERNIDLEKVVQSGSFAKIYNTIEHDIAPIIEPPEKAEDVHGTWVEYSIGEEDDIARAARGTGWCVASPSVGRHYLEYGTYDQDNDWDDDEDYDEYYDEDQDEDYDNYSEPNSNEPSAKSKFILFHLQDPSTGRLSKNAVASIRLDPDGQVAEISGLKEGQALNDSLVDMVAEKVKTLPGGEKFLEAFADKQELIRLDRKMQNDEDLTKEELEFIYEINRPIHTLDTYNNYDPRINELRNKYNVAYAIDAGIEADNIVSSLKSLEIADELNVLITHGVDIDKLVSKLDSPHIYSNLDILIENGANIEDIVSKLNSNRIVRKLDTLIENGANIDIDNLVSSLDSYDVEEHLGSLINHGADIRLLMSKLDVDDFDVGQLSEQGADVDILASKLDQIALKRNFSALLSRGANINLLTARLDSYDIERNFEYLVDCGADINLLVSKLKKDDLAKKCEKIIDYPNIDINQLISKLSGDHILIENLNDLIKRGADIEQITSNLNSRDIIDYFDELINHGASVDQLIANLEPSDIAKNLDDLIARGANIDIDKLLSELEPYSIANNLDILTSHGANIDIDQLLSKLDQYSVAINLEKLIDYGADINQLVAKFDNSSYIFQVLKILIRHGADINKLIPKLNSDDTEDLVPYLINNGADVNLILSNLERHGVERYFDELIDHGADMQQIVDKLGGRFKLSTSQLNTLRAHGWQG